MPRKFGLLLCMAMFACGSGAAKDAATAKSPTVTPAPPIALSAPVPDLPPKPVMRQIGSTFRAQPTVPAVPGWIEVDPKVIGAPQNVIAAYASEDKTAYVMVMLDVKPAAPPEIAATAISKAGSVISGETIGPIIVTEGGLRASFSLASPEFEGVMTVRRMTRDPFVNLMFIGRWPKADAAKQKPIYDTIVNTQRLAFWDVSILGPEMTGWIPVSPESIGAQPKSDALVSVATEAAIVSITTYSAAKPKAFLEPLWQRAGSERGVLVESDNGKIASFGIVNKDEGWYGVVFCRDVGTKPGLLVLVMGRWEVRPPEEELKALDTFVRGMIVEEKAAVPVTK